MIVVVCFQSPVPFFVTPWTAALQASLSFTISLSLLRLMSTEAVMPSNHLILCGSLLILSSIFSSIRKRVGSSHQDNGSVLLHLLTYMCYFLTRRNQLLYYYSPQCYGNNRTFKGLLWATIMIPFPLLSLLLFLYWVLHWRETNDYISSWIISETFSQVINCNTSSDLFINTHYFSTIWFSCIATTIIISVWLSNFASGTQSKDLKQMHIIFTGVLLKIITSDWQK